MRAKELVTYKDEDYPVPRAEAKVEPEEQAKPVGLSGRKLSPFNRFKNKQRRAISQKRGKFKPKGRTREATPEEVVEQSAEEHHDDYQQDVITTRQEDLRKPRREGTSPALTQDPQPATATSRTKEYDFEPAHPLASHDSDDSILDLKQ